MNKRIAQGKLLLLLVASTLVMYFRDFRVSVALCVFVVFLTALTKSSINRNGRYTSIGVVSLGIILFQLLFNWSIPIYFRLLAGALAALRIVTLSLMVFLFTETTSVSDIVAALSFLPKKVCLMLTISFALIPAILKESAVIRMVQQTRGLESKGLKGLTNLAAIIIPLVSRTLIRAEHIAMTLETRGYQS